MKIAVPYENGQIFQHFGHTAQFKLYEVENNAVVSSQIVDTNGSGHGALAGFLSAQGVNLLICGGIGGGAQAALEEAQAALDADPENQDLITARDNAQANVDALTAIVDAAAQDGEQAE